MQFFTTVAVALSALTTVVSANPQFFRGRPTSTSTTSTTSTTPTPTPTPLCLTPATASYLVNGYASLLTAPKATTFNATVAAILSANFTDTSDSINWLAGIPIGATTFPSRAALQAGQSTQLPIGFTVLEIMSSCSEVAFRWVAAVGLQKFPAKGINFFSTSNLNNTQAGYQILNMYSEFNVGAWEHDIGRTCSPQGANVAAA